MNTTSSQTTNSSHSQQISTDEFADFLRMKAASIRRRYSQKGSYFGVRPTKLPNGKLRWPADALEQLMGASK